MLRGTALGAFALCAAVLLLGAAPANAARGDLRFVQCIEDRGPGGDGCPRSAPGLDGPAELAISPDGRSLYVASFDGDAIVHLRRNKRTGKLRAAQCIADAGSGSCSKEVDGLNGAIDVEVSRNGRHVYVLSYNDSTLLHFRRNRRSGKLRLATCIDDADTAPVADICPGGAEGLGGPRGLALSRDGRSLYVASQLDRALVRFDLNRRTGKPRFRECWEDDDKILFDDCAHDSKGLYDANSVVVSPNGRFVYVAATGDSAITRFRRNPKSRALRFRGCVEHAGSGADGCAVKAPGIDQVSALGLSPDGRFLYAGNMNAAALSIFRVAKNGALRPRGCIEGPMAAPPCATTAQGIHRIGAFALDSKGRSLYAAGVRLQPFKRHPRSGELVERPCLQDNDVLSTNADCQRVSKGLLGPSGLAMSPDDRFLYVSAAIDDAVTVFRRKR